MTALQSNWPKRCSVGYLPINFKPARPHRSHPRDSEGFLAPEGARGEYNGKFMVKQYVVLSGFAATTAAHTRLSYLNFFPAQDYWQFSGIRLAQDR